MAKKNAPAKTAAAKVEEKPVVAPVEATQEAPGQTDEATEGAVNENADNGVNESIERGQTAPVQQVEETPFLAPTVGEQPNEEEPVVVLVSTSMALLQQEISQYVEAMRPGREVHQNDGALMQVKLNAAIKSVLRQEGEEFISQMNYLLAAFEEHRTGVFSERYVFRFIDAVPLSRGDRTALERLLNLFMVTADAKSRKDALKHVDLAKVAETLQDGKMQERLFQFYSM